MFVQFFKNVLSPIETFPQYIQIRGYKIYDLQKGNSIKTSVYLHENEAYKE